MTCNFCVTSKRLGTHTQILSNGINMTRPVMILLFVRTSDGGNRSHNVSLPIILKKTKVGQIL